MREPTAANTGFTKIYTVNGPSSTSSSSLPTWLTTKVRAKKSAGKKRQRTQHTLGQLELVQGFSFPQSAIKIKTTPDGDYAMGTGTYKPMIKVWDLNALTEKFTRVTDAENVDFVLLGQDWTKSLHLQADRSLQLHTQGGLHYTLRLPTYGRCLAYHAPSCEALVGATGREVFRFNLEEGRYMIPLKVGTRGGKGKEKAEFIEDTDIEGVNVIDVNPSHGLWSFGLDGATTSHVEFWDPRSRTALTSLHLPVASLQPTAAGRNRPFSVTALKSHPTDGLSYAVGTSTGHTLLYDIRSAKPFAVKDQGYGEALKTVDWMLGSAASGGNGGAVLSADSKVVKVWNKNDPSSNIFSLHPPAPLLDIHAIPHTGLLLAATDSPTPNAYYIPDLGPAPKWASFLDGVTEELEDDAETTGAGKGAYADYKFVDKEELDTLGLTHLIGSPQLKPYMHGFFLSLALYTKARLIANPTSYTEHRERLLATKLAEESESRIRAKKQQPKVNKALAERIRRNEEREEAKERKKRERLGKGEPEEDEEDAEKDKPRAKNILVDPRFQELWQNPDFEVDEESREFELLNPATAHNAKRQKTAVEEEAEESDRSSSIGMSESESESEEEASADSDDEGDLRQYDVRNPKNRIPTDRAVGTNRRNDNKPRLFAGDVDTTTVTARGPKSFGQRLRTAGDGATRQAGKGKRDDSIVTMRRLEDGGMEMSFIPSANAGHGDDNIEGTDFIADGAGKKGKGDVKKGERKVERFGAGLEKGGLAAGDRELTEAERSGRQKRRHPGRSASKNVFRGM
ncbi:Small ribosomal subunit biogenesis [Naganishia albida]|nr:Small ribosomal subunit biogenesis [Naganishia albida]